MSSEYFSVVLQLEVVVLPVVVFAVSVWRLVEGSGVTRNGSSRAEARRSFAMEP